LLGGSLAELALDAQCEPQRLRTRFAELVVARHEAPRLVHLALLVADLAQIDQRCRLVGLEAQRSLEELLGLLGVLRA
jgi:hypothetical protein